MVALGDRLLDDVITALAVASIVVVAVTAEEMEGVGSDADTDPEKGIVTLAVSASDTELVTARLEVSETSKVPVGVMVSVWHTQLG